MRRSVYRGKRRTGLSSAPFFYTGLIMLVLSAAIYLFAPSIRFLALVSVVCGVVAIAYAGLKYAVDYSSFSLPAAVALNIIRTAFLLLALSFIVVQAFIFLGSDTDSDAAGADYLIVLGAGVNGTEPSLMLWSRLNAAVKYLNENPGTVAVLSGGQGEGEDITEAECMRRYLEARNIAPERMILETFSTNTEENIRNSLFLISADIVQPLNANSFPREVFLWSENPPDFDVGDAKIAVLSNDFHLYRAELISSMAGQDVKVLNAPTPRLELRVAYQIREYFSVIKVYIGYIFD